MSADHDEMFLCVGAPDDNQFVQRVADSEGYRGQIKESAYAALGKDVDAEKTYYVPKISDQSCPAWTNYRLREDEEKGLFKTFTYIDRVRMMHARIIHFISLRELQKSGVMVSHFDVHKWHELEKLNSKEERFSNVKSPYLLPQYRNMDAKRNYFGEYVTFYFHWFGYYIWQLILPAILGLIVWFRRYLCSGTIRRMMQDGFAVFIAMWAAYFCEMYTRRALQSAMLWGTRNYDNVAPTRPEYQPQILHATSKWKRVGGFMAVLFLFLIMSGIVVIQTYRYTMIHDPDSVMITHYIHGYSHDKDMAVSAGSKIGALLITAQIKILDAIWGKIARWITDKENHKTQFRWTKSLVIKTVFVKFFNAMYPFLYFSFLKEHVEGCRHRPLKHPDNPSKSDIEQQEYLGCIPGLQTYIMTFFFVHLAERFIKVAIAVIKALWRIRDDLKKPGVNKSEYTYLQIQSKCVVCDDEQLVDDYMSSVVQFGLVTCFSVVLPVLTLFSFLSNLVEYRLIAYRMSYIVKRPHPLGADGIGAWLDIFKSISYLAIAVNCGLGVFAMLPFKAYDMKWKLIVFLAAEHALIFLKIAVESSIGGVPRELEVADDANEEVLVKMFGGSFKPMDFEKNQFGTRERIRCNIDGDKWNETYEHHDLAQSS
eukprot:GEMP01018815.1.p1 GENE.GEMP01018815.1~~GEMP01018815.1.p1  ORF type:complete len:651 (+),score=98.87 GEMP01018815.1:394-2346(+)